MHADSSNGRPASPRRWVNLGLTLLVLGQIAVLFAWDHLPGPRPRAQDPEITQAAHRVEPPVVDEPAIPPQIVDVGYLAPGEIKSFELPFVSPFENCVKVVTCATSCGCLEVMAHPDDLSPEENAVVTVQLEVPERIGHYAQRVKIVTDHPSQDTIEVVLNARIGIPLRSEPAALVLPSDAVESGTRAFEIWNDGQESIKLLYATSGFGRVRVPSDPIEPGQSAVLELEWDHGAVAPTDFDIVVRTACTDQRSLTIPVSTMPVAPEPASDQSP